MKESIRFIAWSALYGTKTILTTAPWRRYLLWSACMWALYLASLMLAYTILISTASFIESIAISASSYLSVSIPSGPAFIGTYQEYSSSVLQSITASDHSFVFASMISWLLLIGPISMIAVGILLVSRQDRIIVFFSEKPSTDIRHKLLRLTDISHELHDFLETYFRSATIGKILSEHEITGKIRLIRTLTGGSKATTVLIEKQNQRIVRKTALPEDGDKLIAQYEWLEKRQHLSHIPNVILQESDHQSLSIEIAYEPGYVTYNDYIHSHEHEQNELILRNVLAFMNEHIYTKVTQLVDRQRLEKYIETKVINKIQDTAAISNTIQSLLHYDTIWINGKEYNNISNIIEKITNNEVIMGRLASFSETSIHGDLTIDNIIVNDEGHFLLLDPNNENAISDPIVDYAKLYQSLHSGYEFLRNIPDIRISENTIEFTEDISSKYHQLFATLQIELQSLLSTEQYNQLLFHEAVHYCRMLPYRVALNPQTAPAFYAIAVRLFNEFYDAETI